MDNSNLSETEYGIPLMNGYGTSSMTTPQIHDMLTSSSNMTWPIPRAPMPAMTPNSDMILCILRSATTEMLQNAQNRAYTDMVSALEMSKHSYEMEVVKNQTLMMAYNALLQSLPHQNSAPFSSPFSSPLSASTAILPTSLTPLTSATTSTTSNYEYMPILKRGDYLRVRFWDKSSFTSAFSGNNATTFGASSNIAKIDKTDYLEDENGTPLTEKQRGAMYSHARRFWNSFLQKSGRFPPSYSTLDLDTLGHFRSEMERHFFELRLCDNHWKVDEIWIRNYHSWRTSAEKQPGMVKTEVCDDLVVKKERARPRKRKRDHSPSIPAKKTASDRNTTNNDIRGTFSDADLAPFDSDPQATSSSASDSPESHISVHVSPTLSSITIESDTVSSPPVSNSNILESDTVMSIAPDTVSSPPVSNNNVLESDTVMSIAPDDSRPLPAASSPPSETSSRVPLALLPTDDQIPRLPDTSQLVADNETLSAAVSLSLLAQPVKDVTGHVSASLDSTLSSQSQQTVQEPRCLKPAVPRNPLTSVKVRGPSSTAKAPPPSSTSASCKNGNNKTSKPVTQTTAASTSKVKKMKTWQPTKAHTPRNVAARDWLSEHPGGTKEEFEQHFDSLTQGQIKDLKKRVADLKAAG